LHNYSKQNASGSSNEEEIDVVCDIHIGCADIESIIDFEYSNNEVTEVPTEDAPDFTNQRRPTVICIKISKQILSFICQQV